MVSALATASAYKCPGSGAWLHAKAQVTATTSTTSCADVESEMEARVKAQQDGQWHDPHNKGVYSVTDSSTAGVLSLDHMSGNKKYTDKLTFTFTAKGSGCEISGCSESQVTSIADFGTNYCNLRMLYCGSADGCKPVLHDFTTTETEVKTSTGATHDLSKCLTM